MLIPWLLVSQGFPYQQELGSSWIINFEYHRSPGIYLVKSQLFGYQWNYSSGDARVCGPQPWVMLVLWVGTALGSLWFVCARLAQQLHELMLHEYRDLFQTLLSCASCKRQLICVLSLWVTVSNWLLFPHSVHRWPWTR